MLELRTLGGLELRRRCDGEQNVIPLQLKRLVLLTYLAAAPERNFRRRDAILGLFWPERDEIHARGALRQALHSLRRSIGDGAILTRGEGEIGLDAAAITWDAVVLQETLARGDPAAALARYHGDFLAGVFVSDASPALDEWIAVERTRLRRVAATAAWAASALPSANGDAAQYVRHAVLLSGDDEEALRRALLQLERMGDRAGAVALYEEVALRVGRDLDVELSSETRAVMQAIRARRSPTPVPVAESSTPLPPAPAVLVPEAARPDAPTVRPTAPRARQRVILIGAALLALLVLVMALRGASARQPSASGDLIAILPFRVATGDSTLAFLHEGMVDLLAIRLAGDGGPRIVDPARLLGEWTARTQDEPDGVRHDVALQVARRAGAGRLIEGSVIGSGARVTLNAQLSRTSGELLAQAGADGPPDSLPQLVDRVAAQLLGSVAGEDGARIGSLAGASLPAIRAYLSGRDAERHGRKVDALLRLREATQLDSTFALAGLELARSIGWVPTAERSRGVRIAQAGRDQLSPQDLVMLDVLANDVTSAPELIQAWSRAVQAYPHRAETWFGLAEIHYHLGPLAGEDGALDRALDAMRRSHALDSAAMRGLVASEAMLHLVELAQIRHDSATVRALATSVLAADSTSDVARALRWHLAVVTSDSARRAFWRLAGLDESERLLRQVGLFMVWTGVGAEDVPAYVTLTRRRVQAHDPGWARAALTDFAYNTGRPGEAPDVEFSADRASHRTLRGRMMYALAWDGDSAAGASAARALARSIDRPHDPEDPVGEQMLDRCVLGQWHAAHGRFAAVAPIVRHLRATRLDVASGKEDAEAEEVVVLCAALLDATHAVGTARPDARATLVTADSLARTLVFAIASGYGLGSTNLTLARLWEASGDPVRALQAVRRRGSAFTWLPMYMTSFLREEGRLAAQLGDTAGAQRAYRQYLALRYDPEPAVRPRVEQVRRELADLEAGVHGAAGRATPPR